MIKTLRKFLRKQSLQESERTATLEFLIEKVLSRMRYQRVNCPLCLQHLAKNRMVLRRSQIILMKDVPVRDDVVMKCAVCNHTLHIGNPMTPEEAREEIKLRGSPYLLTPTYSYKERSREDIKKRLKLLGYGFF